MTCRIGDLKHKEVINIQDGGRLGCVGDLEIDMKNACILALVILGKSRFFGILGKTEDYIINWEEVRVIGEDTILVSHKIENRSKKKLKVFKNLFGDWDL